MNHSSNIRPPNWEGRQNDNCEGELFRGPRGILKEGIHPPKDIRLLLAIVAGKKGTTTSCSERDHLLSMK